MISVKAALPLLLRHISSVSLENKYNYTKLRQAISYPSIIAHPCGKTFKSGSNKNCDLNIVVKTYFLFKSPVGNSRQVSTRVNKKLQIFNHVRNKYNTYSEVNSYFFQEPPSVGYSFTESHHKQELDVI